MATEYFLGCSGFYYNHWKTLFYPEKLPKTKWLQYYSGHFNTLEVNNTFYRFPNESMLKGWYQNTPMNFRFTLKANRVITHIYKFHKTEDYTVRFYKLAHILQEKLLCVLFQLPPSVHKNMNMLEKISEQIDPEIVNVLEFRDESWWDKEVYDFLGKKGLVFCTVSVSGLPETLVKTGPAAYVRFHGKDGKYLNNYPESNLREWAEKIKKQDTKRVFCYFNNDYNAYAVKNCLSLKKFLE